MSFPSPKHDSDRSSGNRSRVLLHSAASSFRVACQTPKKGRSLRCVVEWSICHMDKFLDEIIILNVPLLVTGMVLRRAGEDRQTDGQRQ